MLWQRSGITLGQQLQICLPPVSQPKRKALISVPFREFTTCHSEQSPWPSVAQRPLYAFLLLVSFLLSSSGLRWSGSLTFQSLFVGRNGSSRSRRIYFHRFKGLCFREENKNPLSSRPSALGQGPEVTCYLEMGPPQMMVRTLQWAWVYHCVYMTLKKTELLG